MTVTLDVLLFDAVVGVAEERGGKHRFVYDDAWRDSLDAIPLSSSLPLAEREHTGPALDAYLWGLLPDNEVILDSWAKRFQVSARAPLALLAHVGEDCPGAVRFATRPRSRPHAREGEGDVRWLRERDVASRLRTLREDVSAWRTPTDEGQFSLGGAQPKTALLWDGRRWGVPSGRIPTTHILKPGAPNLDGHAENEHFCLRLALEAGLPVARSRCMSFEDEVAIVVERYDRIREGDVVRRVHQEDCCQALGVPPTRKYQADGGPGPRAIVELLRERSRSAAEDVSAFLDALAINWLVAGTDAHGKNYSVLLGRGGELRLAPLYDVASYLPYAKGRLRKVKLAMKIGSTYRLHEVGVHAWEKLAVEIGLRPEAVRARLLALSEAMPDHAAAVLREAKADGLRHPVLAKLAKDVTTRAKACARLLA